jgi:hypothetical protein
MADLGIPRSEFPAVDRAWVRAHACRSLPEIEQATLRLVALRTARTVTQAAALLGWRRSRRRLPIATVR